MTPDEALEVVADEVTRAAMQEVIDNGLIDTHVNAELADGHGNALRDRLIARFAARPDPATLSDALRMLVRVGSG